MGKRITEEQREQQLFPLESKLQAYVLKRLSEVADLTVFKTIKSNTVGVSDLIINANGKFVAIELKRSATEKPTLAQGVFLDRVRKSNGVAGVAYTWGMVKIILARAGYDTGIFMPRKE